MQLCGSLSSADKALECTQTFLRRSVKNPVIVQTPSPRIQLKRGGVWERDYRITKDFRDKKRSLISRILEFREVFLARLQSVAHALFEL